MIEQNGFLKHVAHIRHIAHIPTDDWIVESRLIREQAVHVRHSAHVPACYRTVIQRRRGGVGNPLVYTRMNRRIHKHVRASREGFTATIGDRPPVFIDQVLAGELAGTENCRVCPESQARLHILLGPAVQRRVVVCSRHGSTVQHIIHVQYAAHIPIAQVLVE